MLERPDAVNLERIRKLLAQGNDVVIKPGGISMLPTIRPDRDLVILAPVNGKLKKYDVPFYRRANGEVVLHRVIAVGETYTCIGDGQFHKETGITDEQVIAVMRSFIRDGKEYSVDGWGYQLYCRLWHHTRKLRHVIKWPRYYARRMLSWLKLKP